MRFHPLAVSVVVGALASSSFSSFSTVVDAFVVPTSLSQTTAQRYLIKSTTTARFLGDGGDSTYLSLDDDTPHRRRRRHHYRQQQRENQNQMHVCKIDVPNSKPI